MNEGFFETLVDFCSGKLLAVLQAYFDESARPGMFVVAGYAFASDQAREVKRELDAVFAPYGGLHMKELVHRSGKFKGISEGKKDYLVKTATTIIRKRFIYGAYVTLNTREFDSYAAKYIKGFGDAYSLCCYLAMVALVSLTRKYGDLTPIHYVFRGRKPIAIGCGIYGQPSCDARTSAVFPLRRTLFLAETRCDPASSR